MFENMEDNFGKRILRAFYILDVYCMFHNKYLLTLLDGQNLHRSGFTF